MTNAREVTTRTMLGRHDDRNKLGDTKTAFDPADDAVTKSG